MEGLDKKTRIRVVRHKAVCPICKSQHKDDIDAMLVSGAGNHDILEYMVQLGDRRPGNDGMDFHRRFIKHLADVDVYARAKTRKRDSGLSEDDIDKMGIGQLKSIFEKALWGQTLPLVIRTMRSKMMDAPDDLSFAGLLEGLRLCVEVATVMLGGGSDSEAASKLDLSSMADLITDPAERQKFIATQRELQKALRTANDIAIKHTGGNGV